MMLSDLRAAGAASVAPTAGLFLPELHHRRDIGLDLDQVNGLADLCHSFTQQRAEISARMTRLAGELLAGLLNGRVCDDGDREALTAYAETRGTLFADAENLMISKLAQGYRLLSWEQIDRTLKIRRGQTSAGLDTVAEAMSADLAAPVRL
jgi:hypothetical protein